MMADEREEVLLRATSYGELYDAAIQRAEQAEAMMLALRECLSRVDRSWEVLGSQSDRVLANTAAAAEAVRKRIELEAVRAFVESVQARMTGTNSHPAEPPLFDVCGRCLKAELAALEAEHA